MILVKNDYIEQKSVVHLKRDENVLPVNNQTQLESILMRKNLQQKMSSTHFN